MKQFLFLSYGFEQPTPEIMQAWGKWFEEIGSRIVAQDGLGDGRVLAKDGLTEVTRNNGAATGYIIFTADDLEHATRLAKGCPVIARNVVQEIVPMKGC